MAVIQIWVNGKLLISVIIRKYFLSIVYLGLLRNPKDCDPAKPLLQFLRKTLGLVGTKSNCSGGCTGACTILVSRWSSRTSAYEHRAMSSCTLPLGSLHRTHITTVEGVGTSKDPHPIQSRLVECHAVQCGYDTPGLVMAVYALLVQKENVSIQEIIKHCDGVFSRCNGYRAVVEAVKSFTGNNSEERKKLEEKIPDILKTKERYPLVLKGPITNWTTVGKVHEAKNLVLENTTLIYGIPKQDMVRKSIIVTAQPQPQPN